MAKHIPFWLGFFAAALLAVPIAAGIMGAAEEELRKAAVLIFAGVAGLVFVLVLILFFRDRILRKIFGRSEVALTDVTNTLIRSVSAATAGDRETATQEAQVFVQQSLGWYTWSNFYRWVIGTALGLLLAFGAFVGTVLLFEQTRTLRLQTERIGEQTKLMQAQTDLMSVQTKRLAEQTKQVELQNEILTLSLVSEIRSQIKVSTEDYAAARLRFPWEINPAVVEVLTSMDRRCGASLSSDHQVTRLPSPATILAIAKLASEGQLAERVREALEFLLHDSESAVRLSALQVLDILGTETNYELWHLDGLFVDSVKLSGNHLLRFKNSIIKDLNCPNCGVQYETSLVIANPILTKPKRFVAISNSIVIDYDDIFEPNDIKNAILIPSRDPHAVESNLGYSVQRFGILGTRAAFSVTDRATNSCTSLERFSQRNHFISFSLHNE